MAYTPPNGVIGADTRGGVLSGGYQETHTLPVSIWPRQMWLAAQLMRSVYHVKAHTTAFSEEKFDEILSL